MYHQLVLSVLQSQQHFSTDLIVTFGRCNVTVDTMRAAKVARTCKPLYKSTYRTIRTTFEYYVLCTTFEYKYNWRKQIMLENVQESAVKYINVYAENNNKEL